MRTASAKVRVPAATCAEYSPRRVSGGEGGLNAAFGQDARGGDRDGEDRGLRVLGELELVFGAFEDELRESEAEGFVGLVEDGAGDGEVVVEVAAHADGLRALSGEEEGWFRCTHR